MQLWVLVASEGTVVALLRNSSRIPHLLTSPQSRKHPEWGCFALWLVRDSNPRRLSRLIYSQIPLAAWVTSRSAIALGKGYPKKRIATSRKLCKPLQFLHGRDF